MGSQLPRLASDSPQASADAGAQPCPQHIATQYCLLTSRIANLCITDYPQGRLTSMPSQPPCAASWQQPHADLLHQSLAKILSAAGMQCQLICHWFWFMPTLIAAMSC